MKWFHYLSCFVAGVFLIHLVPHVLNGLSVKNVAGACVSVGVGGLLLWLGKFSFRKPLAIVMVILGMAAVVAYDLLRMHHL
jgi:hypothetical protein